MAMGEDTVCSLKVGDSRPAAITHLTLDKVKDKLNLVVWWDGSFEVSAYNNGRRDAKVTLVGELY